MKSSLNLKQITNEELNAKMIGFAKTEKQLLIATLLHVAEVERRRMYLSMNYSSLYRYLTEFAGFSNGSAYRLIDAARLQLQVPTLAEKLNAGELSMAQVRLVQEGERQCEQQEKINRVQNQLGLFDRNPAGETADGLVAFEALDGVFICETSHRVATCETSKVSRLSVDGELVTDSQTKSEDSTPKKINKADLLNALVGKTVAESQSLVAEAFDIQPKKTLKTRHHKDGSVTVELKFTKEQWAEIEKVTQKLSNSLPGGGKSEAFYLLAKKENARFAKVAKPRATSETVTPAKKKATLQRDECCQHKDKVSGKICGATMYLQVDHIQPRWAGGSNDLDNLQVLCANHNRFKYRAEAGLSCH